MIVNLYVDHMMATPPTSSEEVWSQTRDHNKLFSDAANRIGMTPAEYREFRNSLLDGKATYVRLPHRLDAMSGSRRGSVYAVHNAVMLQPVMGWRVALADGNVVYVPQACGNISLLRHAAIAHVPKPQHVAYVPHRRKAAFVPAVGPAPETPVSMVAPAAEAPATVAQTAPVAAAAHGFSPFLFGIPAVVGGIVAGVTHSNTPPAPPCSQGSNLFGACQK